MSGTSSVEGVMHVEQRGPDDEPLEADCGF
jgi:hypothetical protein